MAIEAGERGAGEKRGLGFGFRRVFRRAPRPETAAAQGGATSWIRGESARSSMPEGYPDAALLAMISAQKRRACRRHMMSDKFALSDILLNI